MRITYAAYNALTKAWEERTLFLSSLRLACVYVGSLILSYDHTGLTANAILALLEEKREWANARFRVRIFP